MIVTDWLLVVLILQNIGAFLYYRRGHIRNQRWLDVLAHDRKIALIHCVNPILPEDIIADMIELNARVN